MMRAHRRWRRPYGQAGELPERRPYGHGGRAEAGRPRERVGEEPRRLRARAVAAPQQFPQGFANALSEDEAKSLYEGFAVPGSGEPIFQAAAANLNPWTEVKVDSKNPDRGALLIISGELDHTVPPAIAKASYRREKR